MIRFSIIWTVWRKELLETVRDRRSLAIMLLLPIVLYPGIMVGTSQMFGHHMARVRAERGRVLVAGEVPETILTRVAENDDFTVLTDWEPDLPAEPAGTTRPNGESGPSSDDNADPLDAQMAAARERLRSTNADAVLLVAESFTRDATGNGTGQAYVLYDNTDDGSGVVAERVAKVLRRTSSDLLKERLARHPELGPDFARPVAVTTRTVATKEKRGGYFAGRVLPVMLIMMVLLGSFYPAVDITAGEKERGTLQTLLTAPAMPLEIVLGKYLTVFSVAMMSAMANLLSMGLATYYVLRQADSGDQLGFSLPIGSIALMFVQLVPVALLFAAIMLAVSIFARSFKEAQNYLTPVYLLVILPAMTSMMPGMTLNARSAVVPVLNIALLVRDMLMHQTAIGTASIVLGANCLYSLGALGIAARVFGTEQVLLGGQGGWMDVLRDEGGHADGQPSHPTVSFALLLCGVAFVLFFYLGTWLQQADIVLGLVASQILLLAAPAILISQRLGLPARETFSLRPPSARAVVAVVAMGFSSWIVLGGLAGWIQNQILPVPQEVTELMRELLRLDDADMSPTVLVAAFALTPAVCEEVLFRGPVLAGLRRGLGKWPAIVACGVLFGFFHMSVYRVFPTAVIGVVVGWIVWQTRSLPAGILFHFLHNGTTLMVYRLGMFPELTGDGEGSRWPLIPFALLFVLGAVLCALLPVPGGEPRDAPEQETPGS